MHRTYELYLRHPDGRETFEALTHRGNPIELMATVRSLLAHRRAVSIEVREGGAHLFSVAALED